MEKKLISRALPRFYYDDPAVVCERLEAKRMGCKVLVLLCFVQISIPCGVGAAAAISEKGLQPCNPFHLL